MTFSVHDQEGFERVYDEDEEVSIRKGDLRAVLDVATMSMDFASGFLDNEQVEALRKIAEIIGINPLVATPSNFVCQYSTGHQWQQQPGNTKYARGPDYWMCITCRHMSLTDPTWAEPNLESHQSNRSLEAET